MPLKLAKNDKKYFKIYFLFSLISCDFQNAYIPKFILTNTHSLLSETNADAKSSCSLCGSTEVSKINLIIERK